MSNVPISPGEDVPFQTLFINFAEKYYTDPENINAEEKQILLRKVNIEDYATEDSGRLLESICENLNEDFQNIFAINQLDVKECKTPNDTLLTRKEFDSVSPLMVIRNLSIEENISKVVNDLIKGDAEALNDVAGCHRISICTATLKNGEKCKNPSLKSKKDSAVGDFCGKHIPPRTKGKWTNINKKKYVADNIYQTHISYNPIGSNLVLSLANTYNNPTDFKIKLEHSITIQVVGKKKQTYKLVGLIFHIPPPSIHYVAHVKRGKKWYLVDDAISKNLEEISSSDQVFVCNYIDQNKTKSTLHPCLMFYTKEKIMESPPARLLQTGNTCFFDSLMDIILGLESVRKWVSAHSKKNTRQERQTRRANKKDANLTKKNRIDQNDDENDDQNDDENNDEPYDEPNDRDVDEDGDEDKETRDKVQTKICDNQITFNQRKKGDIDCNLNVSSKNWKIGMYDHYNYQKSGRQYVANDPVFEIQGKPKLDPMWLPGIVHVPTTYIYIISKTINKETFYKIGEGGKGDSSTTGTGRLGDAQTYLIPGSIDAGFLVHYLLFFRKNFHIDSKYIGQHVEKQIHATLQTLFPASSISFANGNASEWYSIKDSERNFFFGFVFDIIGSFHEKRMKPLEITRVSPNGKEDEKVELPSSNDIMERMKSNPEAAKVLQMINTFNLRYIRPMNQIFIDRNNPDEVQSYLKELTNIFITTGDTVTLKPPIFKETHAFTVIEIKKPGVHAWQRGLSNRLIYVTVQPVTNSGKITQIKAIEWADKSSKPIYYVDIHLFLENLHPFNNQSDENKKQLEHMYDFFKNHYEKNQSEVPLPVEIFPSYFLYKPFQDRCGNKFVLDEDSKKTGKYHDDYSIEIENNTDENQDSLPENQEEDEEGTKPAEVLYSWKVMKYENQMIYRKRWNRDTSTVFGDEEMISVLRLMKIADVKEMKNVKVKKGSKNTWRKQTWEDVEDDKVTIDGQTYEVGDTVLIDDSQFIKIVNDMPSTSSDKRLTYVITGFYNDTNLDTTLNPLIVVQEKTKGIRIKRDQESIYTSANPDIMRGHIEMLTPGRLRPPVEPKYKDGDVIKILDMKELYDDIVPFSNNDLAKKWKGVHYANIMNRKRNYYGFSFFPPYDTPTYWESGQEATTYVVDIRIEKLERHSKLIDANDRALELYTRKLPFQITGIEVIISHSPKNARRETVQKYRVRWAAENGIVIEPEQSKENMENFAEAQVELYWAKKSTPIDAYNADHIDDDKDKKNFARKNVGMIVESINKRENLRRAFTLAIDNERGFKIGDIFIIQDVSYFLCYFTTDLESNGASYKYGLCEPTERKNGRVKEFTYRQLLAELGGSTITYFREEIPSGKKSYFKDMIDRYNNLLKVEQNRLLRNTRKNIPTKPRTKAKQTTIKTKAKPAPLRQTKEKKGNPYRAPSLRKTSRSNNPPKKL